MLLPLEVGEVRALDEQPRARRRHQRRDLGEEPVGGKEDEVVARVRVGHLGEERRDAPVVLLPRREGRADVRDDHHLAVLGRERGRQRDRRRAVPLEPRGRARIASGGVSVADSRTAEEASRKTGPSARAGSRQTSARRIAGRAPLDDAREVRPPHVQDGREAHAARSGRPGPGRPAARASISRFQARYRSSLGSQSARSAWIRVGRRLRSRRSRRPPAAPRAAASRSASRSSTDAASSAKRSPGCRTSRLLERPPVFLEELRREDLPRAVGQVVRLVDEQDGVPQLLARSGAASPRPARRRSCSRRRSRRRAAASSSCTSNGQTSSRRASSKTVSGSWCE